MNINPHDCKIMLTEPPMNPLKNRQKMIEASLFSKCLQKRTTPTYAYIRNMGQKKGGELSRIVKRHGKLGKKLKKLKKDK